VSLLAFLLPCNQLVNSDVSLLIQVCLFTDLPPLQDFPGTSPMILLNIVSTDYVLRPRNSVLDYQPSCRSLLPFLISSVSHEQNDLFVFFLSFPPTPSVGLFAFDFFRSCPAQSDWSLLKGYEHICSLPLRRVGLTLLLMFTLIAGPKRSSLTVSKVIPL